jgi:FkbM family methyltransferase
MKFDRLRPRARRWVAQHRFPLRRELLIEHHRLPAARLRILADMLVPRGEEDPFDVVEVGTELRMELDMRSLAQRAIAYRLSDETELALVRTLLRPGDVAIDVGANVGLYSLVAALAVRPGGTVYALEPNPRTAEQLRRNLDLNEITNVIVHGCAAASTRGSAVLRLSDPLEPGLATIASEEGEVVANVETVRVDDVIAEYAIEHVSLLKIDAEGAEADVLDGARTSLENGAVDRVLFEVLDGRTAAQELLVSLGYELQVVERPGSREPTRPYEPQRALAYANILAVRR